MAILTHSRSTDFLLLPPFCKNESKPLVRLARSFSSYKIVAIVCLFCINILGVGIIPSCGQRQVSEATATTAAATNKKLVRSEYSFRKAWFDSLALYTKIRESCDLCNDHPSIFKFNKFLKINPKSSYCSTSGIYTAHLAGMKFDGITPMAYSWRQQSKLVFYPAMLRGNNRRKPDIKLMDAVIFTFSHVEFTSIDPQGIIYYDEKGIWTTGCNTKGGGKRVQGCYSYIFRPWSLVYAVYNHVGPWYQKNILTF